MENNIAVGMSGGVDSAVAALLLQREGFAVQGITMQLLERQQSAADAKAVAAVLGIPLALVDLRREFWREVVEPFGSAYAGGKTPNPCIDCNRWLKFDKMAELAATLGCPALATGHYAAREWDAASGRWLLCRAADLGKDQSYFLYVISQQQLAHTHFPLAHLNKEQIRAIAAEAKLPVAEKKDSQDICFIPDGDYVKFLQEGLGIALPKGDFVSPDGIVLGQHEGQHRYTLGQRRGLGIAVGSRIFVVEKRPRQNQIVLGEESLLYSDRMLLTDCNWVSIAPPTGDRRIHCKARYRQEPAAATLHPLDEHRAVIQFDTPQRAITVGQAGVCYEGNILLGGGTITPMEEA